MIRSPAGLVMFSFAIDKLVKSCGKAPSAFGLTVYIVGSEDVRRLFWDLSDFWVGFRHFVANK
jgi:hypothetical protein